MFDDDEPDEEFIDKWMEEHPDILGRDGIEPPPEERL